MQQAQAVQETMFNGIVTKVSEWIEGVVGGSPESMKAVYDKLGAPLNQAGDEVVAKHLAVLAPLDVKGISGRTVRKIRCKLRLVSVDRSGRGKVNGQHGQGLNQVAEQIAAWRESKGFVTPDGIDPENPLSLSQADAMLGKLMLCVTELAEAAEAVRHGNERNFREEIADTVIRLCDIAHTTGIYLEREIARKMAKNEKRPLRHGKKTSL